MHLKGKNGCMEQKKTHSDDILLQKEPCCLPSETTEHMHLGSLRDMTGFCYNVLEI